MQEEYDYADNINCIRQLLSAFGQLESVKITISLDIKIICANLCKSVDKKNSDHRWFYRPQINTDWHRLRAEGSD